MTDAAGALFECAPIDLDAGRVAILQFAWHAEPAPGDPLAGRAEPTGVLVVDATGVRAIRIAARTADALARLTDGRDGPDRARRRAIVSAAWQGPPDAPRVSAVRVVGGEARPIGPAHGVDLDG